jgi:hypothetical protein
MDALRFRAERPGQDAFIRNRRAGRGRSSEWLGCIGRPHLVSFRWKDQVGGKAIIERVMLAHWLPPG